MLQAIISQFQNFRKSLYDLLPQRADSTMDLVDALSSNTNADSVVKLSLNPLFRPGTSTCCGNTNYRSRSDIFHNGMVIPLFSEFLEYDKGDIDNNKQDCELRAFHRFAKRLKKYFPRLPIILLLDGLYANGPVMECCREYEWQYMIVLKNKELPSIG